jgi:alpha-galactosidase
LVWGEVPWFSKLIMMQKRISFFGIVVLFWFLGNMTSCKERSTTVWLDELEIEEFSDDIRPVKPGTNYLRKPISIGGQTFERGIGVITISALPLMLNGQASRFTAAVGPDDEANPDLPVRFYVVGDGQVLFDSGGMKAGDAPKPVDVNLKGIQQLGLLVTDSIGGVTNKKTYSNWADAKLVMHKGFIPQPRPNQDDRYILTPVAGDKPAIHSPKVFGTTPGNPFLYPVAASGSRPMYFSADHLPEGLLIDSVTGIIDGKISRKGNYEIILRAKNNHGKDERNLTIRIGDTIALTPPMGWNGWNSWASAIDQEKVMSSARAMIHSGLKNFGWMYINIDDTWQGKRGGPFHAIQPNEKFPDLAAMVDSIHAMGLKAGLYSTPYISSYGGYPGASSNNEQGSETRDTILKHPQAYKQIGKYRFETNDAAQMAAWGIDYLKYDWRIDVNSAERMSDALRKSGRDIFFSLSNLAPFDKAGDWARTANAWRTGADIRDSWLSLYTLAFGIDAWAPYGGPGHWNDPDMMVLGNVTTGAKMHPTRLTPDEQYSHVSIYSLLAAPLLIGCPLEQLDSFTLNLLTNSEVLEINQDPLGKPGRLAVEEDGFQIWVRPMTDGSFAVGLFNTGNYGSTPQSYFRWGNEQPRRLSFSFEKAGLSGSWKLRDVWRQKDLGEFTGEYQMQIPYHGVQLLRMIPLQREQNSIKFFSHQQGIIQGKKLVLEMGEKPDKTIFSSGQTKTVWLDELKIRAHSEGIPSVSAKTNAAGDTIIIGGISYDRGIGVRSTAILSFQLNGKAKKFMAKVGADDQGSKTGPVRFYVVGDRKVLFESGEMNAGDAARKVDVDLRGIQRLGLLVTTSENDRIQSLSDWADARFLMAGDELPEPVPNSDEKIILTPAPAEIPRINSPAIFGATPGNPFLYTIVASGQKPMIFSANHLPDGLTLDSLTGIISGLVTKKGTYPVLLQARNEKGKASKLLTIKIGNNIGLTPPMGWNGWNSWAREIDREKVIASAHAMVNMGLKDHGWTYINIDDAWQSPRAGKYHAIQPNEKFPDFPGMIAEIHSLGLKAGLYSTPWITSYAGYPGGSSNSEDGAFPDSVRDNKRAYRYVGQYTFEENDARQMAEWGIDYLKYDWRLEVPSAERMAAALKNSGRDIFYSLSNSAPFAHAEDWSRIANAWRTGPDIRDSWHSLHFSAFTIDPWAPFAGPGHWNDPDMLIIGNVSTGMELHPTRLTPNEQYSHVSLFSLLAAPLLIGCPIEQLDDFTLNLLTNDEVIEINQDPLGKPGSMVVEKDGVQIRVKQLHDGSCAVGLFHVGDYGKTPQSYFRWGDEKPMSFTFNLKHAGLTGKWKLRDVWRQKDLGVFENTFSAEIPHHGVLLLRLYPKDKDKL